MFICSYRSTVTYRGILSEFTNNVVAIATSFTFILRTSQPSFRHPEQTV
ncbi:MAG: hypothetical protein HC865_12730 [Cyanobacteria bacterium RU_5_0]|nr:hypothetical protein [Cyanobacteria bacterium RU_5_0]